MMLCKVVMTGLAGHLFFSELMAISSRFISKRSLDEMQ
jgi:hypothetical protein